MDVDLQSLKLAIDTGNPDLYHGNWNDVFGEVVDELIRVLDEGDEEAIRLQDEKDDFLDSRVETFTDCAIIKENSDYEYTIYNKNCKLNVNSTAAFEDEEYEIIVRVLR